MMPEASNNEQEGVGSDRLLYEADAMYAAVQGEEYGDTFHAVNWADKPHRVLYDAINLMRDSAATIAGLQRENAALKIDASNHAADAETVRRERDAESRRAEAAEAEVKRLQTELALSKPLYSRRQIEARVKSLEEALKPFAKIASDGWGSSLPDDAPLAIVNANMPDLPQWLQKVRGVVTQGDCRRARDTLASTGGEHHAE